MMIRVISLVIFLTALPGTWCVNPRMVTTKVDVTVAEGRTAILPCRVKDLGLHKVKVAWSDQWLTVLTFNSKRVIDNQRIGVERPRADEWNLRIDKVTNTDQGIYTCTVNTKSAIQHKVALSVVVPPSITSPEKDSEVSVREFEEVRLTCNATGFPEPTITWFKLPSQMGEKPERVGETGEVLIVHNVTRHCGGRYQCEASNTVSPNATRVWNIKVEFEPEVHLANKRLSQSVGKDTVLECLTSGHPQANVFWSFNKTKLGSSKKHKLEIIVQNSTHLTLMLYIHNIQPEDFGHYTCTAINALGRTQRRMTLREHKSRFRLRHTSTTTTASSTTSAAYKLRNRTFRPDTRQTSGHPPEGRIGLIHNGPDIIDMSFREGDYTQRERRPAASKIKDDKNSALTLSSLRCRMVFSVSAILLWSSSVIFGTRL